MIRCRLFGHKYAERCYVARDGRTVKTMRHLNYCARCGHWA